MSDPTLNSLTFTVSAPSLSKPSNNSMTDITGEITVDLSTPIVINSEIHDMSININNVDNAIVSGKFPPNSKFSNIKVTGPNSNNYKLYDVGNNIVSDPSLAFKIVVPSTLPPSSSLNIIQILIIVGIVCAILIGGFLIFRNMKSKKNNLTESGGYYYFN
jgi:hypothetical protein